MKASALRVLTARVHAKAMLERQAAQQANLKSQNEFYAKRQENEKLRNAGFVLAVRKNMKKYVEISDDGCLNYTAEGKVLIGELAKKYPDPAHSASVTDIQIASLNIRFDVLESRVEAWKKFATACDDAFLNDDARGILEALEAL